MDIHVYLHNADTTQTLTAMDQKLDQVLALLGQIIKEEETMANELDALRAEVDKVTTVEQSAIVLINGISQALKDAIAANDPAALTALTTKLDASATALAEAVAANTPAAPPAA